MATWLDKLRARSAQIDKGNTFKSTVLRKLIAGSFYKVSDLRQDSSIETIRSKILTMRALTRDSQISTALSYYATDATTANSAGNILWATPINEDYKEAAAIINAKIRAWKVNSYARDHILELATMGNLYLPTTDLYKEEVRHQQYKVSLDHNGIRKDSYEIIASSKLQPENVIHLWYRGIPMGYAIQPDEDSSATVQYPEGSIIHFSLGGLLGEYTVDGVNTDNEEVTYDIQFGSPLMEQAVQPTQTLSLLEDSLVLSSLTRIVRFINVDCGNAEEEEIQATLQQIKDMIEQQLSINTATGDVQSFVNPQSPNNLIYIPKINGQDAISVTDMNMTEATDADNKLLEYYQNKKLSVLGVPKEAMNFSSSEGLGGAGAVMSQRSAIYANALQRLETAYIEGWRSGFNEYFIQHNLKGYVDQFELHMNPIVTEMSTISFDKRDSAISQASSIIEILKSVGITDADKYRSAIAEILTEALPKTSSEVAGWEMKIEEGGQEDAF